MQCPNCQATLESYALKCEFCGVPLRKPYASMESPVKGEVRLRDSHTEMEKKRSKGVTFLSWFFIVLGLFNSARWLYFIFENWSMDALPSPFFYSILLILLISIAGVVGGIGMLKLIPWARKLIITITIFPIFLAALIGLKRVFTGESIIKRMPEEGIFLIIFVIVYIVAVIYFLTRPKVKEQFR